MEVCLVNKENKTTSGIASLKDDRAHLTRFLVVILSRPNLHMEDTISTFKMAAFPRTLFSSDGSLLHCVAKSELINILEGLPPHSNHKRLWSFLMALQQTAAVQSMGTLSWMRNKRDLESHFIGVFLC